MEEGAYLYDAKEHALQPVAAGDYREAVAGGQDFVKAAPVSLVLVSDLSRLSKNINEGTKLMGAVDVGIVCQNINIACAGMGLATVPRASMNQETLKTVLKLTDNHLLLMNNPVGYPKK
jgi:SagB-type dehydrogenase family enzyme